MPSYEWESIFSAVMAYLLANHPLRTKHETLHFTYMNTYLETAVKFYYCQCWVFCFFCFFLATLRITADIPIVCRMFCCDSSAFPKFSFNRHMSVAVMRRNARRYYFTQQLCRKLEFSTACVSLHFPSRCPENTHSERDRIVLRNIYARHGIHALSMPICVCVHRRNKGSIVGVCHTINMTIKHKYIVDEAIRDENRFAYFF